MIYLKAILPFGTNVAGKLGYSFYEFDSDQFPLLIEPLLNKNDNDISFWVYAPYYNDEKQLTTPTFDKPIYQNESGLQITADIFNLLIVEQIFNPTVYEKEVKGVMYMTYSQSVPPDAKTKEEIQFYLLLMIEKNKAKEAQIYLDDNKKSVFGQCVFIILIGLLLVITTTMIIAWHTGWKIVRPVADMTKFTEDMKQAASLQEKKEIVKKLSNQQRFKEVDN